MEKKEYLKMRKIKVKNLDIGSLITMIKLWFLEKYQNLYV